MPATRKTQFDLPDDGAVTRAYFHALPKPPHEWAWELCPDRLRLTYMPVTYWHSRITFTALLFWLRSGHEIGYGQYVADSAFLDAGRGGRCFVTDGLAFRPRYRPDNDDKVHHAANVHAVIDIATRDDDAREAAETMRACASLGIARYWLIRADGDPDGIDGILTTFDLADGHYALRDRRLVSQIATADT